MLFLPFLELQHVKIVTFFELMSFSKKKKDT